MPDIIPGKGIKLAVRVFDFYVSNMINNNLARNSFSEPSKIASVRAICSKEKLFD